MRFSHPECVELHTHWVRVELGPHGTQIRTWMLRECLKKLCQINHKNKIQIYFSYPNISDSIRFNVIYQNDGFSLRFIKLVEYLEDALQTLSLVKLTKITHLITFVLFLLSPTLPPPVPRVVPDGPLSPVPLRWLSASPPPMPLPPRPEYGPAHPPPTPSAPCTGSHGCDHGSHARSYLRPWWPCRRPQGLGLGQGLEPRKLGLAAPLRRDIGREKELFFYYAPDTWV